MASALGPDWLPQHDLVPPVMACRPLARQVRVRCRARVGALQQRARAAHPPGEHAADHARPAGGTARAGRRDDQAVRACAGRTGGRVGPAAQLCPRAGRRVPRAGRGVAARRRVRGAGCREPCRRCVRGARRQDRATGCGDGGRRAARRRRPSGPAGPAAPPHPPRRAHHVRSRRRARCDRRNAVRPHLRLRPRRCPVLEPGNDPARSGHQVVTARI